MNTSHYKIEFGFGVGKDRDQKEIPAATRDGSLAVICDAAAERFGAYTLTPTTGGWTNPDGVLVTEPGFTLFVVVPELRDWEVSAFAEYIAEALDQQAIAVTVTPVLFHLHFNRS